MAKMLKLKQILLASSSMALISVLLLFASYVKSAVAYEPVLTAATTEQTTEFITLLINEGVYDYVLSEQEDNDVPEDQPDVQQKSELPEKSDALQKPMVTTEIQKTIEVIKTNPQEKILTTTETIDVVVQEIHRLSNQAREKRGKSSLIFDSALSQFAELRSSDMLEKNYFSHTSPDGCDLKCNFDASEYNTLVWGENIARYQPFSENISKVVAELFVEKWLTSSGHRDNLLSENFTHHGVGAVLNDGELVITVIFARPE